MAVHCAHSDAFNIFVLCTPSADSWRSSFTSLEFRGFFESQKPLWLATDTNVAVHGPLSPIKSCSDFFPRCFTPKEREGRARHTVQVYPMCINDFCCLTAENCDTDIQDHTNYCNLRVALPAVVSTLNLASDFQSLKHFWTSLKNIESFGSFASIAKMELLQHGNTISADIAIFQVLSGGVIWCGARVSNIHRLMRIFAKNRQLRVPFFKNPDVGRIRLRIQMHLPV